MQLVFDIRGNLHPAGMTELNETEVFKHFVDPFAPSSSRHVLFTSYQRLLDDIEHTLQKQLRHWLNGSFISNRTNPKDIDLVFLADYALIESNEKIFNLKFSNTAIADVYGLDAYFIKIYPEGHSNYFWTQSDLAYWRNWFGRSKMDRRRKRYNKGFVAVSR